MRYTLLPKCGWKTSVIGLGGWPLAGMVGNKPHSAAEAERVLAQALACGITHFDTAFCYGATGESELAIGRVIGNRADVTVASKGGVLWRDGCQIRNGSPEALLEQCDLSLKRLRRDAIDLYYLHAPDPAVPIAASAGAIRELIAAGKVRSAGLCNASLEQTRTFHQICPLSVIQGQLNMLQRELEQDLIPWCVAEQIAFFAYRPLMTGLLTGQWKRTDRLGDSDLRSKVGLWQGAGWDRLHDFLDQLRRIDFSDEWTLPQLAIAWVLSRPGVTTVLCGATRPEQIAEVASAAEIHSGSPDLALLNELLESSIPDLGNRVRSPDGNQ